MSFAFTNEEDDDFGALSNNSNLASIFHDPGIQQSSSKSLVYTAPKQPISQKTAPTSTNNTSQGVLVAAAITCYKLTNEKYEALPGKIGLALLRDSESKTYQMILYKNKQKPFLASVKITPDFTMISQPDNFCTFYDDLKQNWAVLFDSKDIAQKFLDEIDQIRSILAGQNRTFAKEVPSEEKTDGPLSSPFENNFSFNQESNKTKLISRIAKLGQPILPLSGAIVAEESDSDQMPIAQSSPEVVEPPQERTKPKKMARPIPTSAKPIVHHPPVDFNSSLNSMVVPSSQYASMMSGQQPFPVMQFIPPSYPASVGGSTQHFDTLMSENRMQNSEVRMHLCRLTDKIDLLLQKTGTAESHPRSNNNPSGGAQLDALTIDLHVLQGQSKENSNKLDLILSELSASRNRNEDVSTTSVKEVERLLASERGAWAANQKDNHATIGRLKQENERLAHQIEEMLNREKNTDARIQQLLDENYRLKNDVEMSASSISDDTTQLREENTLLNNKLDDATRKEQVLANQYRKSQEQLECCETKCAEIDSRLLKFQSLSEEKDRQLALLQEQVQKYERELSHARSLVEDYQAKLKVAEDESKSKSYDTEQESVEEKVKIIMNKTYKEIMKQFQLDESYTLKSIKSIVSVVIRDVTLAALNGEPDVVQPNVTPILQRATENMPVNDVDTTETVINEFVAPVADTIVEEDHGSAVTEENGEIIPSCEITNPDQLENERKERSISFLETLHSSLAAASLQNEQAWKPDPPPPPLFDDFDNEDDWLA